MKIGGPAATTGPQPGSRRAPAATGGFALASSGGAASAAPAASASASGPLSGLEALLALQELGGPLERRRRALARGGRVLDELDRIHLVLLEGGDPMEALGALSRTSSEARERADEDPGLEGLLDQIDLRAAVELAKAERRRAA